MAKTLEQYFIDWEAHVFGYGYGTGEPHIVPLVKQFLARCPLERSYNYQRLEQQLTPAVAWLLINIFCQQDVLEYGASPRVAWLTTQGKALKAFVDAHSAEELLGFLDYEPMTDHVNCSPGACNCGPQGYEAGRKCGNPFWKE